MRENGGGDEGKGRVDEGKVNWEERVIGEVDIEEGKGGEKIMKDRERKKKCGNEN